MKLDEVVDQIIENAIKESEKQPILIKHKLQYKIGTEIETTIQGRNCDDCGYCRVCDNCPVCDDCERNKLYCNNCDEEIKLRIIEIAEENEWISPERAKKLRENLDSEDICAICQAFRIWSDVFCPDCGRCEDCQYVFNPNYCPYQDEFSANDIDIDKIDKYLDNYYYDESCGMEFVTKPFENLKDYWEAIKAIVSEIGKENIRIVDKCGGHINISWDNGDKSWLNHDVTIASNILFFSDLLSYMFCSNNTYCRDEYKVYPHEYNDYKNDFIDKYTCVHIKDYAIEVRIPDSPKDIDNHVLFSAVLLAISFRTTQIPFDEETFYKTKEIYEKINRYGEELSKQDKAYLKDKFKLLKRFIEKPLKALSHDIGIDLAKALEHRFQNPKYEEKYEEDFNLEQFAIKPKVKAITNTTMQLPLTAFA
ncbi:MAG: hypothetical protein J7J28_05445 [Thaumarchaeota archaeon]|nr:hypothetical protein [Nitrososphaerota archaeon]